jgi:excinuclease ABC subunit C
MASFDSDTPPVSNREEARRKLHEVVDHLPAQPGVYLMRGRDGTIIYIGKAKSLKSRVRSYFTPNAFDGRAQFLALVHSVWSLDYIVTDNEVEALVLEANLVKLHKPRYNVTLKDDKKYPFVRITNEPFPRIFLTRDIVEDGSRYLGPFSSAKALRKTLATMHKLFRVRSCDYALPDKNVRLCLDYEIKRCDGPCKDLISREDYRSIIDEARLFITGRHTTVMRSLKQKMEDAAGELKFEEAASLRDRLVALQRTVERQKVVSEDQSDWDTVGIHQEDDEACGVVLEVREGRLIGSQHYFIGDVLRTPAEEVAASFVQQYYTASSYVPPEIDLRSDIPEADTMRDWLSGKAGVSVDLRIPQRGTKVQLVAMAENNARLLLGERRLKRENRRGQLPNAVKALMRDLHLEKPPRKIEAIDISTMQGTDTVASLVCFVDGKPKKSLYRHFQIKGIEGPDDFASMRQVVERRFRHLIAEKADLPDILMVDGGKGQLSSALSALSDLGVIDQPVIGLAKRLEEVFIPGHSDPQNIPKTSASILLLRAVRDESHRFANTYHKKLRRKRTLASQLDEIDGVGPGRRKTLLRHFGSLKRLKEASVEDIAQVEGVGPKLAAIIHEGLKSASPAEAPAE